MPKENEYWHPTPDSQTLPTSLRLCADSDRDSDEGVDHPASQQLESNLSSRHVSYPYK